MSATALTLFGAGLARAGADPVHAVDEAGRVVRLPLERWLGEPAPEERALLARVRGPALDLGCGPGRHVVALRARGVEALGIDASDVAARLARTRGAPVVQGSVFGRVPRAGSWRAGLLLDGNLGIGGDPARLLGRAAELLAPDGDLWVELTDRATGPGTLLRLRVAGRLSEPFPWTSLGVAELGALVVGGPWRLAEHWRAGGRRFARLERR